MRNTTSHYAAAVQTPVGQLGIVLDADRLVTIEPVDESLLIAEPIGPVASEVVRQLEAYFNDPKAGFDLPLSMVGSEFQQKVWRQLQQIRPGQVMTYGEIAKQLNSSPRAVGGACRANPLLIVVPCHRVVARSGIGGFGGESAGSRVEQKRWLLAHEGAWR